MRHNGFGIPPKELYFYGVEGQQQKSEDIPEGRFEIKRYADSRNGISTVRRLRPKAEGTRRAKRLEALLSPLYAWNNEPYF